MAKIKAAADVRLSLAEAKALLRVANAVLTDGDTTPRPSRWDNGIRSTETTAATRALQRMVEVFGGKWEMRAGAVASDLFD